MARRDDVREVMRGLVAPESESRNSAAFVPSPIERRKNNISIGEAPPFSSAQEQILSELRAQLCANGIEATETEIALALLESLARRPALCRGLLADYLTKD